MTRKASEFEIGFVASFLKIAEDRGEARGRKAGLEGAAILVWQKTDALYDVLHCEGSVLAAEIRELGPVSDGPRDDVQIVTPRDSGERITERQGGLNGKEQPSKLTCCGWSMTRVGYETYVCRDCGNHWKRPERGADGKN